MKNIKKSINISKIRSHKVRNILRGIICETDSYKIKKALSKIKNNYSSYEYNLSLEIIRESNLFLSNSVIRDFPKTCPRLLSELTSLNQQEILNKINLNEKKLIKLLVLYKELIQAIQLMKFRSALSLCGLIIEAEGVSCFLVRVLFYFKNHVDHLEVYEDVSCSIDEVFYKIESSNIVFLENAIRELSSPRTDYFNICGKINASNKNTPENYIAKSFISHIPKSEDDFIKTLNAFYSFSILDAYLFYANSLRLELFSAGFLKETYLRLSKTFKSLRATVIDHAFYAGETYSNLHINFFRECFLLIELDSCFKYKTVHGSLYNKSETKELNRSRVERRFLNEYFEDVKTLNDLSYNNNGEYIVNLEKFNSKRCNYLENSNALLFYMEKNDANVSDGEEKFIELMSYTVDVGYIFPKHYFYKMEAGANTPELKLVVACLLSIDDYSDAVDYNLRKIIQHIVALKYNSKIKVLIEYMYSISPSVTHHLIQVCDETFLSKLFHIINKPNEAIEERACILEWYGNITSDTLYIDRAKNLRIDVQISKEKGTIDDSRIYVDPLKFTQWINNNVQNDITIILEDANYKQEVTGVSIKWESVHTGISQEEQIASLLLKCFSEFCNNNLFGIASYLGRRIRHGTFKGTGLSDVKDISTDDNYNNVFSDYEFIKRYEIWFELYNLMLEELKSSYLHINCKRKPQGLIFDWFNTSTKKILANHMLIDVLNSFNVHGDYLEIPYIITDYCWRIVEEDLASIRKTLMEYKSKHTINSSDFYYIKHLDRRNIQIFCQDLNSITVEKFRTISSWFNKPSIASPSANLNLLFNAVVSEIKAFDNKFEPKLLIDENEFKISGGEYFAIYDALYILIYNAAKYGKSTGELEFKVRFIGEFLGINISIISEVLSNDYLDASEKLINTALSSDIKDANVVEGRSGIKKLRLLAKEEYISDVKYAFSNKKITASFNYRVDFEI